MSCFDTSLCCRAGCVRSSKSLSASKCLDVVSKALRFLFLAVATVVAIVLIYRRSGTQESPVVPQEGDTGTSVVHEAGGPAEAELPEVVRLVVRSVVAGSDSDAASEAKEVLIGEYEHLGPVDAGVRDGFVRNCEQQIRKYQKMLARDIDSSSSEALVKQAYAVVRLILEQRQVQCLLTEDYLTTAPDAPKPPLHVAGAQIISTGGFVGGEYAELTFILPLASDPELRSAIEYRNTMTAFDASEKARRFNELPDAERAALAARLRAILKDPEASPGDRQFIVDTIGSANVLDADVAIVRRR